MYRTFYSKVEPDHPDREAPIAALYYVQRQKSQNGQNFLQFG